MLTARMQTHVCIVGAVACARTRAHTCSCSRGAIFVWRMAGAVTMSFGLGSQEASSHYILRSFFFLPPLLPPSPPLRARARSLSLLGTPSCPRFSLPLPALSKCARTHTPSLRSDSLLSPMPPAILFNFGTAPLDWVVEFRNKRTLPAHHHPTTLGPLLHVRDHVPMQSTARPLSHSRVRLRVHDSARRCRALRAACACMHWLHACKQHALVACMQWWHGSRCWLKTLPRVDLCITRSPSPAPFRFSFAVISRCVLGCTPCRASPAALPRPRLPCRA